MMELLRKTIRNIMLQETNRSHSWRQVEKIMTQVLKGVEDAYPQRLPVDPISHPDLHMKGHKTYRQVGIERGHRSGRFSRGHGLDVEIFAENDDTLNPITQELPTISISKAHFDRFDNKGTTKLSVASDLPWGTGQYYEFEMQDIIADGGQEMYDLLIKLVKEML